MNCSSLGLFLKMMMLLGHNESTNLEIMVLFMTILGLNMIEESWSVSKCKGGIWNIFMEKGRNCFN